MKEDLLQSPVAAQRFRKRNICWVTLHQRGTARRKRKLHILMNISDSSITVE